MARVGDRIVVESEKVGQAAREGEILEIIPSVSPGGHFLVRWDDGHESDFRPSAGSARIVERPSQGGTAKPGAATPGRRVSRRRKGGQ
ncbi:MAG TPA: DUF1918 domain-containing protein [Candidatus Limnocylindrales bacterium]